MSSDEEEINDQQSDNMEQEEDKVNVEETTINFGCIKKERDEGDFEFDENRYKLALTFDKLFGDTWKEQRDNRDSLIGFLDDEVIMETGCIKLEGVEEEEDLIREIMGQSDCNKCGVNYERYCPECSSLSHILNNLTPNINPEPALNTVPINMLEIREISTRQAVIALKVLPKGIILGPFEGLTPIKSTTGPQWKIKDKKLVNDQNGNWMKYIESVGNHASKNLDVFQFDGILYFETSREIYEGEELLVCYREEKDEVFHLDKDEEFYLIPVQKEGYPKVFACTLCCLGFRLEKCLMEHKNKCSQGEQSGSSEDFQIIQCQCCKVWLEKQEHLGSHMLHCLKNHNRLRRNLPDFAPTNTNEEQDVHENDEAATSIDRDATYSTCPTETIDANDSFSQTEVHKEYRHNDTKKKAYKCSKCSYRTNDKSHLKSHLGTHIGIKDLQCDICKKRYAHTRGLKAHIKEKHSNTNEKEYKCSECSYQTNRKGNLKTHLDRHKDISRFQCDICKQRFAERAKMNLHIKDKHSNTNEKEYKCSECSYQTNHKGSLKIHLGTHSNHFQCDICKQRFNQKVGLQLHIKDNHSNTNEKDYKCSECPYQTNHKGNLKLHLDRHNDFKHFQCDICKQRFNLKVYLKSHIKHKHSNANKKESFQCEICETKFSRQSTLTRHIKHHHS